MRYSIVIPTCNDVEVIKPLIEGIIRYTDLSDGEVIVAANGSPSTLHEYIKSLGSPFKLVSADKKIGVASAFNLGCKEAKGEVVILMNDDSLLLQQPKNLWLLLLLSPLKDEKVGIAGKLHRDWSSNRDFIISFCTIIRQQVFKDIGYFDPIFNPYFGEDVDFCIRAQEFGWKIASVPMMPLYHQSHTEGNPTARSAKIISQKSNILRERYNKDSFVPCGSIWDKSKAVNHVSSEDLATALKILIPKEDLVIDLGCGIGYYCDYLDKQGYDVIAIEGTEGINEVSVYKDIFRWNLTQDLILPGTPKNTTVISFEVGEHLPREAEAIFLHNLTKQGNRVIMSWAVPGQGGDGHVNERPNQYIIEKMAEKGFFLDEEDTSFIRSKMANSPLWWFKNTLMVFNKGISRLKKGSSCKRLHIGCGDEILPGYVNCDLFNEKAEVRCDAEALPFKDGSFDEVYACHLIEHFDFKKIFLILKEWRRVLKDNGRIVIETPDLLGTCKRFVSLGDSERVSLYGQFFSQPWVDGLTHKFLFTETQLKWTLGETGFKNIVRVPAERYQGKEDINLKMVGTKS